MTARRQCHQCATWQGYHQDKLRCDACGLAGHWWSDNPIPEPTPDLPPVGATVGRWTFDGEEWYSATDGYAPHGADITARWHAGQRIKELEAENAALEAEAQREHETDETLLSALITETLCRLPAEIVADDWERHREEHLKGWLGQHRAFGGWLSGQITAALDRERRERDGLTQRLATFEALAREAKRRLDSPYWMSGSLQIAEEVARLATPGEDTAHG